MAVLKPANENLYVSTSALTLPVTACGWFYATFPQSAYNILLGFSGTSQAISISIRDNDGNFGIGCNADYWSEYYIGTNEWHHITLKIGTVCQAYLDGVLRLDNVSEAYGTPSNLHVGAWDGGYDNSVFRAAHVKVWEADLSLGEIQAEMNVARPVRTAGLWAWYQFIDSTTVDYSGNGRTLARWENTGTFLLGDGPPVGWGAAPLIMQSAGTAPPGPDYGTPYDHSGVWPFSSIWRPARV